MSALSRAARTREHHPERHERRARLEVLDEGLCGDSVVLLHRPAVDGTPVAEQLSVGRFPAPEPWLAHVLPI
jgi:hypothetical protein